MQGRLSVPGNSTGYIGVVSFAASRRNPRDCGMWTALVSQRALSARVSSYPPPHAVDGLPDPPFPHLDEYLEMLGAQPDRRSVLLRGEVGGTVHTHRARTDRMLSVPTHGDAPSSL